jgi:tyrosine-protein kinase Etk/Wzc
MDAKKESLEKEVYLDEDEIDLRELVGVIWQHKLEIVLFALVFLITTSVYLYFKPNIYKAHVTIELPSQNRGMMNADSDLMAVMPGMDMVGSGNIENEMEIIKSTFVAKKSLKYLNIGIRYYINRHHRLREIYRNVPFVVSSSIIDDDLIGYKFRLIPVDKKHYRLILNTKPSFLKRIFSKHTKPYIIFDDVLPYGKNITTPWFSLKIERLQNMPYSEYFFSITPNDMMYDFIKKHIEVKRINRKASILEVSFYDNVQRRAVDVVSAVVRAYIAQELEYKTESARNAIKFIDSQLNQIRKVLEKSGKKLEEYKSKNVLVSLSEKAALTANSLSEYQSKLQELMIEENILKNLLYYIKNNEDIEGITLGAVQITDPALIKSIEKLQEALLKRKSLLVSFTKLHPDVVRLTQEINNLRKNILFLVKNDLSNINSRKASLQKIISEYKMSIKKMPAQEQRLANLTTNYKVNEKIYSFLLQKRTEAAITEASKATTARIIDSATLFTQNGEPIPVKPKRKLIIVVSLMVGLILGVFYSFLVEFLKNTIESPDDIERLTSIPFYGSIPFLKSEKQKFIFMEAFRTLRTNIQFMAASKNSNTIVVSSTMPGEGKTTISRMIAVMFARINKKVVLLDMDLRLPKQHIEMGGISTKTGMSTLLSGMNSIDDVLVRIEDEDFYLIPAGPKPPNPSEMIASENIDKVLAELKKRFDYIIIDTPPVGLVTDAMILMQKADLSLLVTRVLVTKKDSLRYFQKYVGEFHIKSVGIVLNGAKDSSAYGYGGYGKYGSYKSAGYYSED